MNIFGAGNRVRFTELCALEYKRIFQSKKTILCIYIFLQ